MSFIFSDGRRINVILSERSAKDDGDESNEIKMVEFNNHSIERSTRFKLRDDFIHSFIRSAFRITSVN